MSSCISALLLLLVILATGCASINGPTEPHDPFERYNRSVNEFNQTFDNAIAIPVAKGYQKITPAWVEKGISNFFSNLDDVVVMVNNLLQLKIVDAVSDTARIFINSTVGLLGFIDVATHMELPKHREDFGQTLGYWGVPPGPYFVLPFLGPSTIRDSVGIGVDFVLFDPIFNRVDNRTVLYSMYVMKYIDIHVQLLAARRVLDTAALDPYEYARDAYFQRRLYYVYDGDPPEEEFDDSE